MRSKKASKTTNASPLSMGPTASTGGESVPSTRLGMLGLVTVNLSAGVGFNTHPTLNQSTALVWIERWSSMSKPTVLLFGGMLRNRNGLQQFRALPFHSAREKRTETRETWRDAAADTVTEQRAEHLRYARSACYGLTPWTTVTEFGELPLNVHDPSGIVGMFMRPRSKACSRWRRRSTRIRTARAHRLVRTQRSTHVAHRTGKTPLRSVRSKRP